MLPKGADVVAGAVAALGSYGAVWLVRHYSIRRGVLDRPSERSSHTVPTPRGGGLGVVVAVLLVAGARLVWAGASGLAVAVGALAVVAVAAIGWMDDHRPLPARVRLVVHLFAGLVVAVLADRWLGWPGAMRPALAVGWAFWTVSAINVVNFMDGIDGLIGSQLAIYAGFVAVLAPAGSVGAALGWVVAGASLGFLCLNWSPARIFLGDVGSGAYGVLAVLLGLGLVVPGDWSSIVRAFVPLVPLFLDAAATLVRRARAGERLTTPHRRHLYQRLANGRWGHARTSVAYAAAAGVGCAVGLMPPGPTALAVTAGYLVGMVMVGRTLEHIAPWETTPARVTVVTERHPSRGEPPG